MWHSRDRPSRESAATATVTLLRPTSATRLGMPSMAEPLLTCHTPKPLRARPNGTSDRA